MPHWFGLGTSKRLYSDQQIAEYNRIFNRPLFLVADSMQAINEAMQIQHIRKAQPYKQTAQEFVESLHTVQEKWRKQEQARAEKLKAKGYRVITFTELSRKPEFKKLMAELHKARRERAGVQQAIHTATLETIQSQRLQQKLGSKYEFGMDVAGLYTLNEVASTLFFARKGFVKAGHAEEARYDRASHTIMRIRELRRKLRITMPKLKFHRLPARPK
ncbi:MAG: hypothetical protein Q7S92_02775 [Candidatus Diapherotrites archaeon]|nr:hypothetical protein [Candidatus Diapherotrites archaeon]